MKVNFWYLFIGILLVLFSCSDGQKEEIETISMDELIPKSERDYNYDDEEELEQIVSDVPPAVSLLKESFGFDNVESFSSPAFPSRFSFQNSESWELSNEKETVKFSWWSYKDSLKTTSVFFNWLDCFPPSCNSIRIYDSLAPTKQNNFAIWTHDTLLIYVEDLSIRQISSWQSFISQNFLNEEEAHYHFYPIGERLIWE